MSIKLIKANRVVNPVKRWMWVFIPIIAVGGLFWPILGLLLLPIMVTLMTLGLLKGKYWCGNYCPHASLFDHILLPIAPLKRIPLFFKSKWFVSLFFVFFMTMFVRRIMTVTEYWGSLEFVDKLGFLMATNYLMPTILGAGLALTVNPRTWCSFCPMGTMQKLAYKLGKLVGINKKFDVKVTISDLDKCRECGKCASVCPLQLEPYKNFSEDNQFEHEDCIKCSVCVANCPLKLLSLEKSTSTKKERELDKVS